MNKVKRASQFGRSMIEMLGVLAIIGVLSVGGISGYTEAMRKYKVNKTIEIFRASLFRLMELDQMKWGKYEEIAYDAALFATLGLFPEEICDKNYVDFWGDTGTSCQLPVGDIRMVFDFGGGEPMMGEYEIAFTGGDKERNCVDFLSYHWEKITPKDWWNPTVSNYDGGFIEVIGGGCVYGGKKNAEREECPTDESTMDNIAKVCHEACEGEECQVFMIFRDDDFTARFYRNYRR